MLILRMRGMVLGGDLVRTDIVCVPWDETETMYEEHTVQVVRIIDNGGNDALFIPEEGLQITLSHSRFGPQDWTLTMEGERNG